MGERIEAHGDLWAQLRTHRQSLRTALARLQKMLGPDWPEDPSADQSAQRQAAMREGRARRSIERRSTAGE
jgi:hypothetical protein